MKGLETAHLDVLRAAFDYSIEVCSQDRRSRNRIELTFALETGENMKDFFEEFESVHVFGLGREVFLVGWQDGKAYALTPNLGSIRPDGAFVLAPAIIERAIRKVRPAAQWMASRSERHFLTWSGCAFVFSAAIIHYFRPWPSPDFDALVLGSLGAAVLLWAYAFIPLGNWVLRRQVRQALAKLNLA